MISVYTLGVYRRYSADQFITQHSRSASGLAPVPGPRVKALRSLFLFYIYLFIFIYKPGFPIRDSRPPSILVAEERNSPSRPGRLGRQCRVIAPLPGTSGQG